MLWARPRTFSCLLLVVAAACAADREPAVTAFDPSIGSPAGGVGGIGGADAGALPGGGGLFDTGIGALLPAPEASVLPSPEGGPTVGDLQGCTGVSAKATPAVTPKVDIVWVVDGSLSMVDEQAKIGANLAQFADAISNAEIDLSIVLMTKAATLPFLCPPVPDDPLANSPLAGDPRYHFLWADVESRNALDIALSELRNYQRFLRPDAAVHFVFVTDNDSAYGGQLTGADARAMQFRSAMMSALGKDFTSHTVSSEGPIACTNLDCTFDPNLLICAFIGLGCGASAPGATYWRLAEATNGLTVSICEQDWTKVFEPLKAKVIEGAPLPCEYHIPPPPSGESLDTALVNVGWRAPDATQEEIFPRAGNAASCAGASAWYYDDPATPGRILLCPEACQRASALGGTMNIAFGCRTVVLQ
jgi:hypothetical protein